MINVYNSPTPCVPYFGVLSTTKLAYVVLYLAFDELYVIKSQVDACEVQCGYLIHVESMPRRTPDTLSPQG